MPVFTKRAVLVDGIRVEVLEAGSGEPLVYLHGAGATSGFQDILPLAQSRRLIVPIHPGFGASDDDAGINSMLDYVVHYNALFDQLDLVSPIDLVGHSLGGWMAGLFTVLNGRRVRRLALACPAGLRVAEHPTADMFTIRAEQVPAYIVSSPDALARIPSTDLTVDMRVGRYRELTSLARIMWDRNYDRTSKGLGIAYFDQRGRYIRGRRTFAVLRGTCGRKSTGGIPRRRQAIEESRELTEASEVSEREIRGKRL